MVFCVRDFYLQSILMVWRKSKYGFYVTPYLHKTPIFQLKTCGMMHTTLAPTLIPMLVRSRYPTMILTSLGAKVRRKLNRRLGIGTGRRQCPATSPLRSTTKGRCGVWIAVITGANGSFVC